MQVYWGKNAPLNVGSEGGRQMHNTTIASALKQIYYSLDKVMSAFYVHVTVHRNKFLFNKTNWMH
jgi:hypothetical protein